MSDNGQEYETVDPRVQVELERLNNATDTINRLEVDLDEARANFRQLLCDSSTRVESMRVKLGLCVEKAKPYYEARFQANEALRQTQVAAMRYERANSAHSAAREMVYLAEQGLGGRTLDPAWQEMLNHATQRVNDAERERGIAGSEHRTACINHDISNCKVQALQKELKRAIAKSSFSARRSILLLNNIVQQHQLLLTPYYEMKAHFNHLLEVQKSKVQCLESQVCNAKLTYAEALRNLEQISDEIHQTRSKTHRNLLKVQESTSSSETVSSLPEFPYQDDEEYLSLPPNLSPSKTPIKSPEEVDGYKNVRLESQNVPKSHSNEWTEINLEVSSPEDDIPYQRLDKEDKIEEKPKLIKQKTMPTTDVEFSTTKKINDSKIVNWISRSSAKDDSQINGSRRQSLDNILGPTSERVKEIFSQGIMMLNISSLTERRNSETKDKEDKGKCAKKIPSPLEKTLTYLTTEDDISDSESLASSVDMLSEDQINSLMLDKEINDVCEKVLGTPINEICPITAFTSNSSQK